MWRRGNPGSLQTLFDEKRVSCAESLPSAVLALISADLPRGTLSDSHFPVLVNSQMLGEKQNLADVMCVMSDLAIDGLHDGVWLGANRHRSCEVRFRQRFERVENIFPAALPHFHLIRRVWRARSQIRCRDGDLVSRRPWSEKSRQRERMFPAMCFTMMAMELDSASSVTKRASSGHCAIARSPNFL